MQSTGSEELGDRLTIRVDANQGYSSPQLLDFCAHTDALDVARGGFVLDDGYPRTTERPGLGVELL